LLTATKEDEENPKEYVFLMTRKRQKNLVFGLGHQA